MPAVVAVIRVERAVDDGCPDPEHQMSTTRRPARLLARSHPAMRQPLHRTLGRRGRQWLVIQPRRRIIDDQISETGYIGFQCNQRLRQLRRFWPCQRRQRMCSAASMNLALFWQSLTVLAGRPAGGTLSGVLDAHREVIPAGHMINGPCARDLSQRRGAAGEDLGDMRLAISRAPHAAHEDRFAFLTYTTEEELADVGDPEC